jgi:hypothetical protein
LGRREQRLRPFLLGKAGLRCPRQGRQNPNPELTPLSFQCILSACFQHFLKRIFRKQAELIGQ